MAELITDSFEKAIRDGTAGESDDHRSELSADPRLSG